MESNKTSSAWGWDRFDEEMNKLSKLAEKETFQILPFIQNCDSIVSRLLNRALSYASDRPQDYVVAFLATKSFRLALSSVKIAMSGYADSCSNILRSLLDISLWIYLIEMHPVEAALGYLLSSVEREIKMLESMIRVDPDDYKNMGNFKINLSTLKTHRDNIIDIINSRKLSLVEIKKEYSFIKPMELFKEIGRIDIYWSRYYLCSEPLHGRLEIDPIFYDQTNPKRRVFALTPIRGMRFAAISETIEELIVTLAQCGNVIGDEDLVCETQGLHNEFSQIIKGLMS